MEFACLWIQSQDTCEPGPIRVELLNYEAQSGRGGGHSLQPEESFVYTFPALDSAILTLRRFPLLSFTMPEMFAQVKV